MIFDIPNPDALINLLQDIDTLVNKLTNALQSVGTDEIRAYITNSLSISTNLSTKIISESNHSISAGGTYTPLNITGSGKIHEITITSAVNTFKIRVTVDGTVIWDKTYSDASALTDDSIFVSAFKDENDKYIYHLNDIPFKNSIKVELINTNSSNAITLDKVFIKYEVS